MASKVDGSEGERVWDPLVRLTHWTIAPAVLLNGVFIEEKSLAHVWIGYAAFGLLALRLVWGVIGTEEARFSSFPPSLSAAFGHIRHMFSGTRRAHRSHNPLGALMAYALWGTLLTVSITGVMLESAPFPDDDTGEHISQSYGEREEEGEEFVEEIHEVTANLLLLLAALHVGGVALESRLSGRNLVGAMIAGVRKRKHRS
ncbi:MULTISPECIES: cytochrome b/b6 domain-containing protein [unclassified Aurantimonas]|uniref:cytochrome b/b6 domain-containing protein n=1 Tax=unclassified Aurantimonas TaxID=2638230 RepID=UPI002E17FE74|nr:cytochrome b/b6 domain-containing protein [Aurantimonas sp. A3-2-R12]